ncbi:MAG: PilZ domain-containing protein [Candidatus Omnitrophota bacterium]
MVKIAREVVMERRRFERYEVKNFVTYKPSRFRSEVEFITNNMSLKGACIFSENQLNFRGGIRLKFYLGPKTGLREVQSRVVYSVPAKDNLGNGFFTGVEFLDVICNDGKELLNNEY